MEFRIEDAWWSQYWSIQVQKKRLAPWIVEYISEHKVWKILKEMELYIENVSKEECEAIYREILEKGYMDLCQYGEYLWC